MIVPGSVNPSAAYAADHSSRKTAPPLKPSRSVLALGLGAALMGLAACAPDEPQDTRSPEEIAEDARARLPDDPVLAEKYARSCKTCHGDPMNGAPLSGDIKAWAKRLEWRGRDGLLQSTLNGFGAMPPLGLCPDCSVEEFEKLIAFLANQPQPEGAP
ncbi:cytochrome c [Tepidicaulis marinus]|uniref:Cytochrome c n=1 Tax=Tepidicaulis marinus TaxID=1333998 RepID=A0A081BBH4_9HYPH|nr:cytochrome c [Tepidicaulis marinus]